MSNMMEMSKEQLLEIIDQFANKMKGTEEKIEQFDQFYSANFIDKDGVLSHQSKIDLNLTKLEIEVNKIEETRIKIETLKKEAEDLKVKIHAYSNEMLLDEGGKDSIKTSVSKLYDDIKSKGNDIINEHKKLFIDEEGKKSILGEIGSIKEKIIQIHKDIAQDEPNKESIKTSLDKIQETYSKQLKEATVTLDSLKAFYKKVFEKNTNELGEEEEGLEKATEFLKVRLSNLIKETNEKLHAITDSSLHNSFYTRAKSHSDEYQKLQDYTFKSVVSIAVVTLLFAIIQLINILWINKTFSYQISYYQIGITLPLIYLVWMFNRNQKIAKKLAEEYHHKAALSEAMTGYRGLYQLKHESPEYMNLFNSIKEQLNINPSSKIDKFLSLKSPQESLIEKGAGIVNIKNEVRQQ
jgi:hypothetical protein